MIASPTIDTPAVADAIAALRSADNWVLVAQYSETDVVMHVQAPEDAGECLKFMDEAQQTVVALFDEARKSVVSPSPVNPPPSLGSE